MEIENEKHFLEVLKRRYVWPGGYPIFFVTKDCEALSFDSAKENKKVICRAIKNSGTDTQWEVTHYDVNWEDMFLYCSDSGELIECAYPADNVCENCGKADYNSTEQDIWFCSEECEENHEKHN